MPDLPDVTGFQALLATHATGQRIKRVDVTDAGVLRGVTPRQLNDGLGGRRIARPERHGKWLIARTDGPTVLLHFGYFSLVAGHLRRQNARLRYPAAFARNAISRRHLSRPGSSGTFAPRLPLPYARIFGILVLSPVAPGPVG